MTLGHHSSMILEHDPPALRGIPGDGGPPGLGPAADLPEDHGPASAPRPWALTCRRWSSWLGVLLLSESIDEESSEIRGRVWITGHSGGIFMKLPWERKAIFTQPGRDHLRARKIGVSPTAVWFTVCFSALRPACLSNVSHVASLNKPSCQVSRWICAELPCSLST